MQVSDRLLWAPLAWVGNGWRRHVLLQVGADGCWQSVEPDSGAPPGATVLDAPALPGLVNAHSHAFQRAFAGLAEQREGDDASEADDFWSWRDRMYAVALRITPPQLRAVAAQLYLELLRGGYTQVCEFHYLQHRPDGRPYDDPLAMAWALADAAVDAGIGLTLMPALYERAGFTEAALKPTQRRFASNADATVAAALAVQSARRPLVDAGLVVHSLRAAEPTSIAALHAASERIRGPIHIHVAEQTAEVQDCLAVTGQRPIEWLLKAGVLDARWQLVHATHTLPAEIEGVARSGAGVVLCPSTEANLGDGLCDLPGWLAAGVPLAIGSDSHVTRDWREELRWLEYGQRLQLRQRNVAAAPALGMPSSLGRLWSQALSGGAAAAGRSAWGLVAGARADLLVADPGDEALSGMPADRTLDALIGSSPGRPWRDVMVAGRWVVRDHQSPQAAAIHAAFRDAMQSLWADDASADIQRH
ncbi:MAG: formimidoylglutamate deiminase [Rubrivivax sp.]